MTTNSREYSRRWRDKNKSKVRTYATAWRKTNIEKSRAYGRKYYRKNPGQSHRWREAHPERDKEINRKSLLKKRGLTNKTYDDLFKKQGLRCAVCQVAVPGSKLGWHIDHDHKTGHVRGILCHHCNSALGQAKDSIWRLQALINYLLRNTR